MILVTLNYIYLYIYLYIFIYVFISFAVGVNLPAGRVIIKSMTIGRDELSVTHYKQMIGRAGRAGQTDKGESFLLIKKIELYKGLVLMNKTLPIVTSQMKPNLDGGKGLIKAILEVFSLGLCCNVRDILEYIRHTLLFQEKCFSNSSNSNNNDDNDSATNINGTSQRNDILPTLSMSSSILFNSNTTNTTLNNATAISNIIPTASTINENELEVIHLIITYLNFLILASSLDISELQPNANNTTTAVTTTTHTNTNTNTSNNNNNNNTNSSNTNNIIDIELFENHLNRTITCSRFGRAIVSCALQPDEAIVIYKDLLKSIQIGLNFEHNLHFLYLLSPLEHNLFPDFNKILKWYEWNRNLRDNNKNSKVEKSVNSVPVTAAAAAASQPPKPITATTATSVSSSNTNGSSHSNSSTCTNSTTTASTSTTSSNPGIFLGEVINFEEGFHFLNKWAFHPPSRDTVNDCFNKLRLLSLRKWNSNTTTTNNNNNSSNPSITAATPTMTNNHAVAMSSSTTIPYNSTNNMSNLGSNNNNNSANNLSAKTATTNVVSTSNTTTIVNNINTNKTTIKIDKNYFEFLGKCKRLWGAFALDELLRGSKSVESIMKKYNCTLMDLEILKNNAMMVCRNYIEYVYFGLLIAK